MSAISNWSIYFNAEGMIVICAAMICITIMVCVLIDSIPKIIGAFFPDCSYSIGDHTVTRGDKGVDDKGVDDKGVDAKEADDKDATDL